MKKWTQFIFQKWAKEINLKRRNPLRKLRKLSRKCNKKSRRIYLLSPPMHKFQLRTLALKMLKKLKRL